MPRLLLELLRPALTQLALLEKPIQSARAWIVALADNALPAPLAGMSFVVYATIEPQAEKYFLMVIEAMSAGRTRIVMSKMTWRLAPPEHQPFGSVQPGVQPLSKARRLPRSEDSSGVGCGGAAS